MLNQLVNFGKMIREKYNLPENGFKLESYSYIITLTPKGKFVSCEFVTAQKSVTEAIYNKKDKARLLVDKVEETFGIGELGDKKHRLYLEKLKSYYKVVEDIAPVMDFYKDKKEVDKALRELEELAIVNKDKSKGGNIVFKIKGADTLLNERASVIAEIKKRHLIREASINTRVPCSICGRTEYPVADEAHQRIKGVPGTQPSGAALISYNCNAFESYGFKGNDNSGMCTDCARNYTDASNYLVGTYTEAALPPTEKRKEAVTVRRYTYTRRISDDTVLVTWTPSGKQADFLYLLEYSRELDNNERIEEFLKSDSADEVIYTLILQGADGRIAVKHAAEVSGTRKLLTMWFKRLALPIYEEGAQKFIYPTIDEMAWSVGTPKAGKDEDSFVGRAKEMLWKFFYTPEQVPLQLLAKALRRIWFEKARITYPRLALIKLILGEEKMENLELKAIDRPLSYKLGQVLAIANTVQYLAHERQADASVSERFYVGLSTNPSTTLARLMQLYQKHLSKLQRRNRAKAYGWDKKMQEVVSTITTDIPKRFTLEEQGAFSLGYFHQREDNFAQGKYREDDNKTTEEE